MTYIIHKTFEGANVRVHLDLDGEPWFVATDVCKALGYRDASNGTRMLEADEKGTHEVSTLGGPQGLNTVSESGLYSLIMSSRAPGAKRFKRWVTREVLPAIRKTGGYGRAPADPMAIFDDLPALQAGLAKVAARALAAETRAEAAETKIAEDAPKLDFADRVLDSKDTLGFREAAKLIREATGAKEPEVRSMMLRRGWIQRLGGRMAPAHVGQARGYTTSIEREYYDADSRLRVKPELRITQKGLARSIKILIEDPDS